MKTPRDYGSYDYATAKAAASRGVAPPQRSPIDEPTRAKSPSPSKRRADATSTRKRSQSA
jgi:hypothetical protein